MQKSGMIVNEYEDAVFFRIACDCTDSDHDIALEFTDEDGFISEAGKTYTLSRSQIIAILHNSLKQALDKLEALEDAEGDSNLIKCFIKKL